jgi:hypothetical protein
MGGWIASCVRRRAIHPPIHLSAHSFIHFLLMAGQAQITSVEAIEAFRANLILFISQARPALEEVSSDILRTRMWLENEQRRFWETELRNRNKKLEMAQAELMTARLSQFQESTSLQQMAVRRARQAVQLAEDKLKALKRWSRDLENRSAPLLKEVEQLHGFMTSDLPKAIAQLVQIVRTLDAYADTAAPASSEGKSA